ncbi:MAG TPA: DUF3943 domain-containing protein [Bacteroidia bacterium]|nr:DUF3943 domain-containing protein [Bacteroidia bacterium]HRS59675.1 DUF3943 domain-containing protein [Bacteroidia bacterium]HRU68596.1 DUF3943 domain-containing protein [Bacteroidia bacterium]
MKSFQIILLMLVSVQITHAQLNSFEKEYFSSAVFQNNHSDNDYYKWHKAPVYIMSVMAFDLGFLLISCMADSPMRLSNFKEAFTKPPVFDDDPFWVNYISHPLMGSESYLRGRESGYGWFGSFLFSTAMSLTWEYLMESWTERPSINDMLVTSTVGSLIGEVRHQAKMRMKVKHHWFVDPLHMLVINIFPPKREVMLSFSLRF